MPRNADETRAQLIRAAERLFAERGVEAVSLREINREADQRNATALQYHFGDRPGLLHAILEKHEPAIEKSRHALLDEIEKNDEPALRSLALALVLPASEKLSDRDGGRAYLRIVAQLINHSASVVDPIALNDDTNSLNRWRELVEPHMSPLAVDPLHSRFTARRIMYVELARRAESPRRRDDRLFSSHLTDLVTAILGASISPETRDLLEERAKR